MILRSIKEFDTHSSFSIAFTNIDILNWILKSCNVQSTTDVSGFKEGKYSIAISYYKDGYDIIVGKREDHYVKDYVDYRKFIRKTETPSLFYILNLCTP